MSLNHLQYESIMRGYERTRDRNHREELSRRERGYHGVPGYRELEDSVSTLCASMTRKILEDCPNARQQLHVSLAELSQRKKRMLAQAGFAEDYLEPLYDCHECHDTGYVQTDEGIRKKCRCFRLQEITLLYEQSNIQSIISKENFSTLSYEYHKGDDLKRFETAVEICRNFVQNFKQDYRNLFFYGTVGTGKSFLSGCVANDLLQQGYSVIYFSSSGLFDALSRYSFDAKSKEPLYRFCQDLYCCDLIIIDDLGTEVTNAFVTSQLFACLNERHLRAKATLISTNLSLEELRDRYSERIFSRITSNYTICKLTGPDIRLYKKRMASIAST